MGKREIITQIGSLPFEDVRRAVEYSLKHDIPFLPELPKRGDGMLDYIKNPGELSCLKKFKKHQFDTVKIQCVGPATLVLSGYDESEAVERIYKHISVILSDIKSDDVILFLDEPALGYAAPDYEDLWSPIFKTLKAMFPMFKITFGVHICGNMDWDKLFRSEIIEIISFDASKFDITIYPFYRNGKRIAWGFAKKEDIRDFRKGDLITPPCGLGSALYDIKYCHKKLEELDKIAEEINPRY